MKTWIIAPIGVLMTVVSHGIAKPKDPLVGTWKLVTATNMTEDGHVIEAAYGQNPTGFLTYTSKGRMMAVISWGPRKPFSALPAPLSERAEAFSTFIAYAGRYTWKGEQVVHHVEAAWREDWVNTDQVRFIVKLETNRVTLRTPPFVTPSGERMAKQELVWDRITE